MVSVSSFGSYSNNRVSVHQRVDIGDKSSYEGWALIYTDYSFWLVLVVKVIL